jgi:molecular chaperone GrpE (heat shock protein)
MTSNHNPETQGGGAPGGPPGEVAEAAQPDAGAAPQATATDQGETLRLLEDARAKADENWDRALRLQAELDNSRKRFERELEGAYKYAIEKFVLELLPVRDSLENALDASRAEQADMATFREGTELTLKMLDQALEKSGTALRPRAAPGHECAAGRRRRAQHRRSGHAKGLYPERAPGAARAGHCGQIGPWGRPGGSSLKRDVPPLFKVSGSE